MRVSTSVAKLGKRENITTDALVRICKGLNCKLEDIMKLQVDKVTEEQCLVGGLIYDGKR